MFYVITSACIAISLAALVSAVFFARYMMAKTRLAEENIDSVLRRKLNGNKDLRDTKRLREEASVMRNLVLDIIENESSLMGISNLTPYEEKKRRLDARTARRRELFGEAMILLQNHSC